MTQKTLPFETTLQLASATEHAAHEITPKRDQPDGLDLLEIEECIRYYPPNLEAVVDPAAVFAVDPTVTPERRFDLFVDVPFCNAICGFCPFNVYRYHADEVAAYLDALEREVQEIKARHDFARVKARTVWIGGGTPSTMEKDSIGRLILMLHKHFDLSEVEEFTFEIKPTVADLTEDKLALLKQLGVRRISMGVQTTHASQLKILGRGHTAADAYRVIDQIMEAGFVINIDMMYRLPGQSLREVFDDLDAVRTRKIGHMSWFPYVSHAGTKLADRISTGRVGPPADRQAYYDMFQAVSDRMSDAGYEQYTPYHFSLNGRCQYHVDRWRMPQQETLGIGPGAFSFFNNTIYTNEHNPAKYAAATQSGPPVMLAKRLTQTERITRLAVLGVKFFSLDMDEFATHSGVDLGSYYAQELDLLTRTGFIEVAGRLVSCTPTGRAFNNDVANVFATDAARRSKHPQAIDLMN